MKINKIMKSASLIDPATTVAAAAQKMRAEDLGCLLVGRNRRLFGILTDRDIVVRALANRKNPSHEPVRNVMSSEVRFCFEDQPVEEAARIMALHGVRRLPVLDRHEFVVGIVSLSDVQGGASRNKPVAVTFYKELPDSCGTLHEVPLSTVYVAGVDGENEAVAAATIVFERDRQSNRWTGAADGCRVDMSHSAGLAGPAAG